MTSHLNREDLKRNELGEAVGASVEFAGVHLKGILAALGGLVAAGLLAWGFVVWRNGRAEGSNEALGAALRVAEAEVVATGARPGDEQKPTFPTAAARDARARELFQKVVQQYGSTDAAGAARLWLAADAFGRGDRATARQLWQEYLKSAPEDVLAATAQRNLWQLDRAEGKGAEAAAAIRSALERGGKGSLTADVLLWELARTERALGKGSEADAALRRILDEHPDSVWAGEARRELATARSAS
jgi:tetratricopeptide (TPR) repeat protein